MKMKKVLAMLLAVLMIVTATVAGTVAWLMDTTEEVKNTFTPSDINIDLDEGDALNLEMVPGSAITKDPMATVVGGSEACWLFVEVTESTTPDLDKYIAYAIADGWKLLDGTAAANINTNTMDSYVIYREVDASNADQEFPILGKGSFNDTAVNYTVNWGANQVGVKPSVTKADMEAIKDAQPTLSFKAYAVQKANVADVDDAWAIAKPTT